MPGENEIASLAYNALCALTGRIEVCEYDGKGTSVIANPLQR